MNTPTMIAMNQCLRVALISAEIAYQSKAEKAKRTAKLATAIHNAGGVLQPVRGLWEGKVENSFMVLGLKEKSIRSLAAVFDQAAYIYDGWLVRVVHSKNQFEAATTREASRVRATDLRFFTAEQASETHENLSRAADGTFFQYTF